MKTREILYSSEKGEVRYVLQRKRLFWWFTVAKFQLTEGDTQFDKWQKYQAKYYADLLAAKESA